MLKQNFYVSRKKVRRHIALCLFFIIPLLWAIWSTSGHFFTEENFEFPMTVIVLFSLIVISVKLLKEIRYLANRMPFITLSNEGIIFDGKYFDQIGLVEWKNIEGCVDCAEKNFFMENYLLVFARNPEFYNERIEDAKQRAAYLKESKNKEYALLWMEISRLDLDIVVVKKRIFQMIEANKKH